MTTDKKRAAEDLVSEFNYLITQAFDATLSSKRIVARKNLLDAYRAALSARADSGSDARDLIETLRIKTPDELCTEKQNERHSWYNAALDDVLAAIAKGDSK